MTHIYQELLARVQKLVRYIGNEWNVIRKSWESVTSRVCLAFPDTYEIGMSHLGMRILYALLNGREEMLAELAYCPWPDMEQEIRQAGLPLVSMESQRPLVDFDVVGFSLQFEMEYTNVLTMLDLGGIDTDRSESGRAVEKSAASICRTAGRFDPVENGVEFKLVGCDFGGGESSTCRFENESARVLQFGNRTRDPIVRGGEDGLHLG